MRMRKRRRRQEAGREWQKVGRLELLRSEYWIRTRQVLECKKVLVRSNETHPTSPHRETAAAAAAGK